MSYLTAIVTVSINLPDDQPTAANSQAAMALSIILAECKEKLEDIGAAVDIAQGAA